MEASLAPSALFLVPAASFASCSSSAAAPSLSFNRCLNRQLVLRAARRTNSVKFAPVHCKAIFNGGASATELKESLDKYLNEHKVVLFMKGTKLFPQCGFSNTVVQILNNLNVPYETVNILESDELRQGLKSYSNWPTFPQLYIDGEFFGGCDITLEAFQSGQLKEVVEKAMCS